MRGESEITAPPGKFRTAGPDYLVYCLLDWFSENARDLPWRRTRDPYAVWVSEVMLQQTQVKTVLPYWKHWMAALPSVGALAGASSTKLHKLWQGLGYYTRVRNMQMAAKLILQKHSGKFPCRFEELLELPGVGCCTAGAISSICFNQPRPILDSNAIRVLTRLFGIHGDPGKRSINLRLWQIAEDLVARAAKTGVPRACSCLNQALMELGALVCIPVRPNCTLCPIRSACQASSLGITDQLPFQRKRPKPMHRRFVAFIVRRKDMLLVRQRPPGIVNGYLWELPNIETAARERNLRNAACRTIGSMPAALLWLCSVKHSITRYRITLEVYQATLRGTNHTNLHGQWVNPRKLATLPFTSAHAKVVELLKSKEC